MARAAAESVDPAWKGAYKAGGIALIIAFIMFLIDLYPTLVLGLPSNGEELLMLAGQKLLFNAYRIVEIVLNFLFIPAGLALYLALKDVRKTGMLVAVALWEVSAVLGLLVNFVVYSVSNLSDAYTAATSEAQRAAYVAASDLAFGFSYGATFVAISITLFVSTLIIGLVMLKGIFRKSVAYLGLVGGVFGLVGSAYSPALFPVGVLFIPSGIGFFLFFVWLILVGYKLYKLGSTGA